MLAAERQRAIVATLRQHGSVSVADLCDHFAVSSNTVRRDLRALEQSRLVTIVHGGAVSNEVKDTEIPFPTRQVSAVNEKMLIGTRAAMLVGDKEAIILDAGTTTHEIAKALRHRQDLTVITNSLNIAQELTDHSGCVTIVSGGVARATSNCLVGALAERALSEWHVAKAFISAGGVDLDAGLTNPNPFEVPIKQTMIKAARQVILVATSDKFGYRSLAPFAPLRAVHTIVTDDKLTAEMAASIRRLGIELVIVDTEAQWQRNEYELAAQEQF